MKKKIIISIVIILLVNLVICYNNIVLGAEVASIDDLISQDTMQSVSTPDDSESGIVSGINGVIGLLQFVGSGISIIVVTILGMKYILASPADKADVKKSIMPIIIGCVLLFGAVNLVSAIMSFSDGIFEAG